MRFVLALAIFPFLSAFWSAVGSGPVAAQQLRSATLAFDNDGFQFWTPPRQRTDWFYTHGTHLEVVLGMRAPAAGLLGLARVATCGADERPATCTLTRVRIAQEIYTPEHLFTYWPGLVDDRPYAGWLSAGVAAEKVWEGGVRSVGVEVGVTGPPSLGGQAHRAIHRWLDKAEPGGWQFELPFELAGAVSVAEERIWPRIRAPGGALAALVPSWTVTIGTLRTSGRLGLNGRFGWNAPPGVEWRGRAANGGRPWLVATLGVDAEAVVHDLFIDGSLWRETAATTREPLVGRLRGGLDVGWGGVGLKVGVTRASRAFSSQDRGHTFGTLGIVLRR